MMRLGGGFDESGISFNRSSKGSWDYYVGGDIEKRKGREENKKEDEMEIERAESKE